MIERPINTPDPLVTMIEEMGDDMIEVLNAAGTTVAVILPVEMYDDLIERVES